MSWANHFSTVAKSLHLLLKKPTHYWNHSKHIRIWSCEYFSIKHPGSVSSWPRSQWREAWPAHLLPGRPGVWYSCQGTPSTLWKGGSRFHTAKYPSPPGTLLTYPLTHGPSTLLESRKFGSSLKTKDLSSRLSPHKWILWLVGHSADLELGQGQWDSARPVPKS